MSQKRGSKGIAWTARELAKPTADLMRAHGVTKAAISAARKRLGVPATDHRGGYRGAATPITLNIRASERLRKMAALAGTTPNSFIMELSNDKTQAPT